MKKLTCLLFALFVGAFAFAGNIIQQEIVNQELENKILQEFSGVLNIEALSKYLFEERTDVELMVKCKYSDWLCKRERKVTKCEEKDKYIVFVAQYKYSKDIVFIIIENSGFYENYYIIP